MKKFGRDVSAFLIGSFIGISLAIGMLTYFPKTRLLLVDVVTNNPCPKSNQ
jgi:hypothetical protein